MAIMLTKDNEFHFRTKHIDVHYHFICEDVKDRRLLVGYVPTKENLLDIFTMPLAKVLVICGVVGVVKVGDQIH